MVQKTFNIFNIFKISAVSSTFFNIANWNYHFNISAVSSVFCFQKNMLETAEMFKMFLFWRPQWFRKHLTLLTFLQFRAHFLFT